MAGDPAIRAKLYMAAGPATTHNPDIKAQYQRLTGERQGQDVGAGGGHTLWGIYDL